MLILVASHIARAHHLHPLGDARTDKRVDKHPGIEEVAPEFEGNHVISHDHGDDGSLPVNDLEAQFLEAASHLVSVPEEAVNPFRLFLEYIQRCKCRGDRCGRRARAEDERRGLVFQEIDRPLFTDDEPTERCECLAECPHHHVNLIGQPEMAGGSSSTLSDHAYRMRVVNEGPGIVFLADTYEVRKIDNLARC